MTVQLNDVRTTATMAQDAPETSRKVLVLACPNARCEELFRSLRSRAAEGDRFTLVVPAVPVGMDWLADMSAGREEAEQRLRGILRRCRTQNLPVDVAEIGDPDPMGAAMDAVNFGHFDEIVVATTRPGRVISRLGFSLADRVRRATGLPVEHVVSAPVRRQPQVSEKPAFAGLEPELAFS